MPEYDVLVVGGGVAGLRAALAAKEAGVQVALLSKTHPLRSHAAALPGGLNAAVGPEDSTEKHLKDSVYTGDHLCEGDALAVLCQEAPDAARQLDHWGVPFHRNDNSALALRQLNGSGVPRAVFSADSTGHVVLQTLYEQVLKEQIAAYDEWLVTSLLVDEGQCCGVLALALHTGQVAAFSAPAVILATGGAGRLYQRSTASRSCTGDGMSLAYRAGLRLMDMEMVQYHPLGFQAHRAFASEATLAEGAVLCDSIGQPVLPSNNAFTRAQLSRFMVENSQAGDEKGSLLLDMRPLGKDRIALHFPHVQRVANELASIHLDQTPLPVRPLMHRLLGGVETTPDGITSLPGLFAAGSCSCSGVHGAHALAGNMLLASVVFGRRAGMAAASHAQSTKSIPSADNKLQEEQQRLEELFSRTGGEDAVVHILTSLAALMDEHVGLVRSGTSLALAADRLKTLQERYRSVGLRHRGKVYNTELMSYFELGALLDVAEAVIVAAQTRKESRGVHYRSDFPIANNEEWCRHICVSRKNENPTF